MQPQSNNILWYKFEVFVLNLSARVFHAMVCGENKHVPVCCCNVSERQRRASECPHKQSKSYQFPVHVAGGAQRYAVLLSEECRLRITE